jgi:hypothetical protein
LGRRARLTLFGIAALVAAALGYGWWQAHTHADVWLQVKNHAARAPGQLWANAVDARVVMRDASGGALAEATLEAPQGLPRWTGPHGAAIDCGAAQAQGGRAWRDCWERQARWMAQWAPRAHSARVTLGRCIVDPVPVTRKLYTDWWFWWVPLPHVGGTPIKHFAINLHVDSAKCVAVSPAP